MNKFKTSVVLLSLQVFVILSLVTYSIAGAVFEKPFGGRSMYVVQCTCSPNMLVVVGPPSPGIFVYTPLVSRLYENYNFSQTHWTLGLAGSADKCWMTSGNGCFYIPGRKINFLGTS